MATALGAIRGVVDVLWPVPDGDVLVSCSVPCLGAIRGVVDVCGLCLMMMFWCIAVFLCVCAFLHRSGSICDCF